MVYLLGLRSHGSDRDRTPSAFEAEPNRWESLVEAFDLWPVALFFFGSVGLLEWLRRR